LQSFVEALDCTAANNRLKRRSETTEPKANSGFTPEFAFNISIETIFLTRTELSIRVRKTFCHHAGQSLYLKRASVEEALRELGKR
jgi:hypothetical protein